MPGFPFDFDEYPTPIPPAPRRGPGLIPFPASFYPDAIVFVEPGTDRDSEGAIVLADGPSSEEIACSVQFDSQLNTGRTEDGSAATGLDSGVILIPAANLQGRTLLNRQSLLWTKARGVAKAVPVALVADIQQDPSSIGADVFRMTFTVRR